MEEGLDRCNAKSLNFNSGIRMQYPNKSPGTQITDAVLIWGPRARIHFHRNAGALFPRSHRHARASVPRSHCDASASVPRSHCNAGALVPRSHRNAGASVPKSHSQDLGQIMPCPYRNARALISRSHRNAWALVPGPHLIFRSQKSIRTSRMWGFIPKLHLE